MSQRGLKTHYESVRVFLMVLMRLIRNLFSACVGCSPRVQLAWGGCGGSLSHSETLCADLSVVSVQLMNDSNWPPQPISQ